MQLLKTLLSLKEEPEANCHSLWSIKLATLFSATGGFGSVIHTEYVDFVPELGWRFQSHNL